MQKDFIITMAWPEGMVAAPGSWYDKFASKNGKYRVGHSALILIDSKTQKACYFDFGRYHTPKGYGRVRDVETDADVNLMNAEIRNGQVLNIKKILFQVSSMKSTHGEGKLYAALIGSVSFKKAFYAAKKMQDRGAVPYGPFILKGSNCSRFVASVIKSSNPSVVKKLRFSLPFCISPSPKRNVSISNHHYYVIDGQKCIKVKKSRLKSYFSSIEI